MTNNFDTVRQFIDSVHLGEWTGPVNRRQAREALDAIEADHFTAADMASAAAQGFREGAASVLGEPVGKFWQHPRTKEWYQEHEGEPLYRAAPVAQQQGSDHGN